MKALAVSLFEGSTQIARLCQAFTELTTSQRLITTSGFYRFTPSNGSHSYAVTAFAASNTGTPRIVAGAGGTAASPPAFVRFTYV